MGVDLEDQQKGAGSTASGTTLSAQQLYQHDPLLVLLKDKWRLNTLWIVVGSIVLSGGVFFVWWFWMRNVFVGKAHFWDIGDTLSIVFGSVINAHLAFTK